MKNKALKKIAAMGAAIMMAVTGMAVSASAYSSNWNFGWTYGANSQYSKPYTTFSITIGNKITTVTNGLNGQSYNCYSVRSTPYISVGNALPWVDNPQPIEVQFTCPSLTLGTQYMSDSVLSGHPAVVYFTTSYTQPGYSRSIKVYAENYSHYSSCSGYGVATSNNNNG